MLRARIGEQARTCAWLAASVHSREKRRLLTFTLHTVLDALNAATLQGQLFAFVPDFYVERYVRISLLIGFRIDRYFSINLPIQNEQQMMRPLSLTELCMALRMYLPWDGAGGDEEEEEELAPVLVRVGEFLARHFCDARIVYAESKDALIQVFSLLYFAMLAKSYFANV